jgi:hypothetical protein
MAGPPVLRTAVFCACLAEVRTPPGMPFRRDAETLRRGLNSALTSDLGPISSLASQIGQKSRVKGQAGGAGSGGRQSIEEMTICSGRGSVYVRR